MPKKALMSLYSKYFLPYLLDLILRNRDARVAAWQDRMTPLWKRVVGGCTLNRPIDELVSRAGFAVSELTTGYIPGPRPMTYMYEGCARMA